MCTVKAIEGTTVFLELEDGTKGSMILSEVAAGRIRNLREYVIVNKKIVCKVLKLINGHPQFSLRRVTGKEREEIEERFTKEKTFRALIKSVVPNPEPILLNIKEKFELWRFYDEARENPSLLGQFFGKADIAKLEQIFHEKRESEKIAKRSFILKSFADDGLFEIRAALKFEDCDIHYLGSSVFSISSSGKDFKEANSKLDIILAQLEQKAKDKKLVFEIK